MKVLGNFLNLFCKNVKKDWKKKMRGSEFVFDNVDSVYYKWLKSKKTTINPSNNDDKCFQYVLTVALNHEQIKKDAQRITKIKSFINQYNWKEIDFP